MNYIINPIAAIKHLLEIFNDNCGEALTPDDLLAIDEALFNMRNLIGFKQYNILLFFFGGKTHCTFSAHDACHLATNQ